MNIPVIPTIKSVTDLRYQTADIIRILGENRPIIVTRDNDTVAIMLSPSYYQQILNYLDEQEDKIEVKKLEKTIEQGGEFVEFDKFDRQHRRKFKID